MGLEHDSKTTDKFPRLKNMTSNLTDVIFSAQDKTKYVYPLIFSPVHETEEFQSLQSL